MPCDCIDMLVLDVRVALSSPSCQRQDCIIVKDRKYRDQRTEKNHKSVRLFKSYSDAQEAF